MARPQDITSTERLLRVDAVHDLLLEYKSRYEITKYCKDKWGITQLTVDMYIHDANAIIKENLKGSKEDKLAKTITQREKVMSKLSESEQYGLLLQYGVDKAKLEKLYDEATTPVDLHVTVKQK